MCAVAGIVLTFRKPEYAWVCGFIPAGGSFWAQSFLGVCPTCVLAASLFAIAGILSLANQKLSLSVLAGVLFLVSGLVAFQHNLPEQRNLVIAVNSQETFKTDPVSQNIERNIESKQAKLFFSPLCPHCHEGVKELARYDPEGKKCLPVICPAAAVYGGEKMLRDAGYTGKYALAEGSPRRAYPCLQVGDAYYIGDTSVKEALKIFYERNP